jgi:uncharacterized protein (DUF3820 family)
MGKRFNKRHTQHTKEFQTEVNKSKNNTPPQPFNISNFFMSYGKYKDYHIQSIPESYLRWLKKNIKLDGYHRKIIDIVLENPGIDLNSFKKK